MSGSTASGSAPPEAGESSTGSPHAGRASGLVLAALGIVFGDIGTSPLYALQTVFSIDNGAVAPTQDDVYGVISLIFWSVTLIVSVKYVGVLMRADNDGEGGVMALAALARRLYAGVRTGRDAGVARDRSALSLFYGDSVITPAICVLSAVEGLKVAAPSLGHVVAARRGGDPDEPVRGTAVGHRHGWVPVRAGDGAVVRWCCRVAGLREVVRAPGRPPGLSPTYGVAFVAAHPGIAFVAMGAIVLAVTGAEALYADMGHFGRQPIRRAWFFVVFPALVLNYLGQGALILPTRRRCEPVLPAGPGLGPAAVVVLATAATVIACRRSSRARSRCPVRPCGWAAAPADGAADLRARGRADLPTRGQRLAVRRRARGHADLRSSARLATAYGVSVTGALVVDTLLLLVVARVLWTWPPWKLALAAVAFGGVEVMFLAANLTKVVHGGWLPLLIAVLCSP